MLKHVTLFAALLVPGLAFGQETDLDDFDDLTRDPGTTVGSEVRDLRNEEVAKPAEDKKDQPKRRKRVIKTLQRKTFMKIGRTELGLGAGLVTNDPFINRYIARVDGTYHFTEVASIQLEGGFSPDFGQSDWKQITKQIITENQVTPDISKIQFFGNVTLQYAPIYGKVAAPGNKIINFDIYGLFGTGVVNTADDLEALQAENDEFALATQVQVHPSLNFGGGTRIVFGKNIALRVEGRGLSYIEVLEGINLEMKNNFIVQTSFSYFLGKAN
ncbi:MAG: outer membrane beta-barrel domain-containing protein [Alphaproteobacteria bacterium]|nr:outer membrane beta-barrel domain-containing protein [Alphaproteobacteria bacterium]